MPADGAMDLLAPFVGWHAFVLAHATNLLLTAALAVGALLGEYLGRTSTWRQGAPKRPPSHLDRGTYPFIALGLGSSLVVAGVCFLYQIGPAVPLLLLPLGVLVAGSGIVLRLWAMRTLGKFFTMPITVRPDHKVVRNGPYRWLRHPAYTGNFLTALGIPILLGTWVGLAVAFVLCTTVYVHRIRVEERVLLQQLGEAYRQYTRETSRLLPGIY
jgi:protein-S-isoprenylcysteine O-methyltransferase Ste14